MSKHIAMIPRERIKRIAIAQGGGRSLAQVKGDADYICNGGFYDMDTGKPILHLKAGGTVLAKDQYGGWGYCWDSGGDIRMAAIPGGGGRTEKSYISGVELLTPWDGIGAALHYAKEIGGRRGRTALALTGDAMLLYCSGDGTSDVATPEEVREELYKLGAETALLLDGGGSSQCDFAGQKISSSRRVNNYILVWLKPEEKEDKPVKKVCLDPGHGPDTVNGSPDGIYKEREFTWDMYKRLRPLLEAHGIEVICTRAEDEKPSLTARAAVSNKAGADLFVSLHSNASGNGWTAPSGLVIYTSAAGDNAGRNQAAKAILARMKEAGVTILWNGLEHNPSYTVLTATNAPAMIVEYGFHTSKNDVALLKDSAYRDKLAEASCRGILDYLGVEYKAATVEEASADAPADWAAAAWQKSKDKGILDGTRPMDGITRQEIAVVLERLKLI